MTEWLTLSELASYIKSGRSTIYRWIHEKRIPCAKVGRGYRFDRNEVDEWVKSGGAGAETSENAHQEAEN